MAVRRISIPWTRQPQEFAEVNSEFGPGLDVWLPTSSGLMAVGASDGVVFSSAQGGASIGRAGGEVRKNSANFVNALTVTAKPGGAFECWLVVVGSTNNGQTSGVSGGATLGDAATSGLNVNSDRLVVRAASTSIISDLRAPIAGDAIFFHNKNADHRLYFRGVKTVVATGWGTKFVANGLSQSGDAFALLARWTDYTPTDEQIWSLLDNPWQVIAPQQIWVPRATVAAGVPTLSLPTAFNITGTTATPRVTVTF